MTDAKPQFVEACAAVEWVIRCAANGIGPTKAEIAAAKDGLAVLRSSAAKAHTSGVNSPDGAQHG